MGEMSLLADRNNTHHNHTMKLEDIISIATGREAHEFAGLHSTIEESVLEGPGIWTTTPDPRGRITVITRTLTEEDGDTSIELDIRRLPDSSAAAGRRLVEAIDQSGYYRICSFPQHRVIFTPTH